MVRKSALVLGVVLSTWFVLDTAATNAEACGGCWRGGGCRSSCFRSCGSGCYGGGYYGGGYYGGGYYGGGYNGGGCCGGGYYGGSGYYGAPVYGGSSCSSCSAGYTVPGAYAYAVRMAPNYGPSYVLTRAGVPRMANTGASLYVPPPATYRSSSVLRTSYATPLR
jgi:hypothetical protein